MREIPLTARAALPFLPALPVVAALVAWAHFDGGYFGRVWYPGAIGAILLLVGIVFGTGRVLPPSPAARAALLALLGLVAWAFLSMAWADSPGSALESASKLLLVSVLAWGLSLLPWSPRSARRLLVGWSLGVAAACAMSLLRALAASDLSEIFFKGRYMDPLGYANGVTALATMASVPALVIACRRSAPAGLRILLFAVAAFLLQFSLLPQSRGGLIALALVALLLFAIAPDRFRLLFGVLVMGGAAAISVGPIFTTYDIAIELSNAGLPPSRQLETALEDAAGAIAAGTAVAAVGGLLLVLLDRQLRPGPRVVRRVRVGVRTGLAVALVVGSGLALVNAGAIYDSARDRWDTFKSGEDTPNVTGPRIVASYSEQRYDYWRVAVDAFSAQPLTGLGSGNYGRHYDAEREYSKPSRYTHDIWLRFLAEGGIVAALLICAFLGAAGWGLVNVLRRGAGEAAPIAAAAFAVSAYFFVHASFDWLEEFPALIVPALALPLVALAAGRTTAWSTGARRQSRWAAAALASAAGVVLAILALQFIALRYYERAGAVGAANPQRAFDDLNRAETLNPLWVLPHLREGALAIQIDDPARARAAFADALDVEPSWYAHMELALLDAQIGRFRRARDRLRLAARLNASDEFLSDARSRVARRERIDPAKFNSAIRERLREQLGPPRADASERG